METQIIFFYNEHSMKEKINSNYIIQNKIYSWKIFTFNLPLKTL
jgi:hypothetical protein